MGGVTVLHPQDFFTDHPPLLQMNPPRNRKSTRSNRRKQRSPDKNKTTAGNISNGLVMGQVKILKRGEDLTPALRRVADKKTVNLDDLVLSSTSRLGPEPETVAKQTRLGDLYACTAFIDSPPPSSVPMPSFAKKKKKSVVEEVLEENNVVGAASMDIRRLLRLDLLSV